MTARIGKKEEKEKGIRTRGTKEREGGVRESCDAHVHGKIAQHKKSICMCVRAYVYKI
jgi:hypothetical protein